jgi:hypothetical protein
LVSFLSLIRGEKGPDENFKIKRHYEGSSKSPGFCKINFLEKDYEGLEKSPGI